MTGLLTGETAPVGSVRLASTFLKRSRCLVMVSSSTLRLVLDIQREMRTTAGRSLQQAALAWARRRHRMFGTLLACRRLSSGAVVHRATCRRTVRRDSMLETSGGSLACWTTGHKQRRPGDMLDTLEPGYETSQTLFPKHGE